VQPSAAPYFVEEVRKELEGRYGAKQLYENGLSIHTGLDVTLQEAANRALDDGLRRIDKRRGFRTPRRNVLAEKQTIDGFRIGRWDRAIRPGDVVPAVVRRVEPAAIETRVGTLEVMIDKKGFAWTNRPPAKLVKPGDLIEARLIAIDPAAKTAVASLEQPPAVE
jgi:penicillin-binding protein 1A